jgi:hypothetical protein
MTETTSSSRSLFWGFVAIAAGIFLAGLFVAGALKDIRRTNDEITVTGSAKRPIRADHAIWRPSVTAQNLSVTAAFEQVQSQSNRVVAFLKAQGVADSSVTLRPVETYTVESYSNTGEQRPPSYRVTQTFEIRLNDVDAMAKLAREANTLMMQGIPLTGSAPEYIYTELADIRIAMLGDATKDAKTRAERIAESVGASLGAVRSVHLGVFQVTTRNSTDVSSMGINDVSSIEKDITSVVHVTFGLE